jgi:hypothetical protein
MCPGVFSATLQMKTVERRHAMDLIILTTVILAGIALESFISERARRRAEYGNSITDRKLE